MPCSHDVIFNDLCAQCGEDLSYTHKSHVSILHDSEKVTVSNKEASAISVQSKESLLKERKLVLILDLDQTILHATRGKVDNMIQISMPDGIYSIRLRPYWKKMLSKANEMYQVHVYTMGSRFYADKIAQIIDSEKKIINDRVLSRDESGSFSKKSLKRLFPGDQSMSVVIDDRPDVWDYADELIPCKPYYYFNHGDINAPVGAVSDEKVEIQETDDDEELLHVCRLLEDVHNQFYENSKQDTAEILREMKEKVLKDYHIVFSGFFQNGLREKPHLWKLAEKYGAVVEEEITESTSAVLAKNVTN